MTQRHQWVITDKEKSIQMEPSDLLLTERPLERLQTKLVIDQTGDYYEKSAL